MKDRKLRKASGITLLVLLIALLLVINRAPGGMILPGICIGLIVLAIMGFICIFPMIILRFFFRQYSFATWYYISACVGLLLLHYTYYSPTLKIIVPKGYAGEVNLVRSNVADNILTIDSNGIGYITEWTYNKTYLRPIVSETDGQDIGDRCIAFNNSGFWSKSISGSRIHSLSFKIAPLNPVSKTEYRYNDWLEHVDTGKLKK